MFMLSLLPDELLTWIVHITLLLGVIGTVLDYFIYYIPGILSIRIPLKIFSTVLLVVGIFFEGSIITELQWREKVAEVEARVAIAEARAQEATNNVQEKIVEKVVEVEKRIIVNHDVIVDNTEIINQDCKIPEFAFQIYNNSVTSGGLYHE